MRSQICRRRRRSRGLADSPEVFRIGTTEYDRAPAAFGTGLARAIKLAEKIVKSVRRVFDVLELFGRERRPLAAVDVARKLQLPLTSTHAILKSMRALGYLSYEESNWTYFLGPALPNLVDWVRDSVAGDTELMDFVSALATSTRETINLSRRIGGDVKIVFGIESSHAVGVTVSMGTLMPIGQSLTGLAALACLDGNARRDAIEASRARGAGSGGDLDAKQFSSIQRALKRRGTVTRCDVFIRGVGAICVPISANGQAEPLILGIVGPSDRILENEREYDETVRRLIKKFRVKTVFPIS